MHRTPCRWLLPAAVALAFSAVSAISAAQAQNPPRTAAPPDPLDAQAAVPAFVYRSPLSSYQTLGDPKPLPWREANDTVGAIGGWRAYAREASEAAAATSATPSATTSATPSPAPAARGPAKPNRPAASASAPAMAPMPAGHGGHRMN